MFETLSQELDRQFAQEAFLTLDEVAKFLKCSEQVIYNWTRRSDPKRRPPRLIVGKEIRFPKREFAKWLAEVQFGGK